MKPHRYQLMDFEVHAVPEDGPAGPSALASVDKVMLGASLASVILLQRFVIQVGASELPVSMLVVLACSGYLALAGRLQLALPRLGMWLVAMSMILAVSLSSVFSYRTSSFSLVYMLLLYVPLLLVHSNGGSADFLRHLHQRLMLFVACLGLGQFALQLVGVPHFDPFSLLPASLVPQHFNTNQTLAYGSTFYKPNGVLLLEASFFSQFTAVALLLEVLHSRRLAYLAAFSAAFLVAFSGTGAIVLMAGLPLAATRIPMRHLAGVLTLGAMALGAFVFSGFAEHSLRRLEELDSDKSSFHIRFISPYERLFAFLASDKALWGAGPGAVRILEDRDPTGKTVVAAEGATFVKLFYEYGLLAGGAFAAFLLVLFFDRSMSLPLAVALFVLFGFMSGALLDARIVYYCWLLGMTECRPRVAPATSTVVTGRLVPAS